MAINGVLMGVDDFSDEPPPYDREVLHLPPTMITEYRDDANYEHVIAEQMDFLWNAFDFDRCINFDQNGRLKGK